jgi:hypothetical protein
VVDTVPNTTSGVIANIGDYVWEASDTVETYHGGLIPESKVLWHQNIYRLWELWNY